MFKKRRWIKRRTASAVFVSVSVSSCVFARSTSCIFRSSEDVEEFSLGPAKHSLALTVSVSVSVSLDRTEYSFGRVRVRVGVFVCACSLDSFLFSGVRKMSNKRRWIRRTTAFF